MLSFTKSNTAAVQPADTQATGPQTTDTGKIRLGGACRLPVKTADTGKIRLGGACRLPVTGG